MGSGGFRYTYFLAHASPDAAFARELYDRLMARGVACFLDKPGTHAGDAWDLHIPREQAASAATVVLLSRHYDAAWYLRDEVCTAIRAKRAGTRELFPVLVDGPVDPPPYGLSIVQALDRIALGTDGLVDALVERAAALDLTVAPREVPASSFGRAKLEALQGTLADLDAELPGLHARVVRAMPPVVARHVPATARATPAVRATALVQAAAIEGDATLKRLEAALARPAEAQPFARRALEGWRHFLTGLERPRLVAARRRLSRDVQAHVRDPNTTKPAVVVDDLVALIAYDDTAWEALSAHFQAERALPGPLLEERWLAREAARHAVVPIVGFSGEAFRLDIDEIVVPLQLADHTAWGRRGSGPGLEEAPVARGSLSVTEALTELARRGGKRVGLSVVGHPGAGKTTLLQQLFTTVCREGSAALGLPEGLAPVYLRLARHWARIAPAEGQAAHLEDLVERDAAADNLAGAGTALAHPDRRLLVLLDGLDEVPDEATRLRVCGWLRDECTRWRGSRFVVTCRLHAWTRARDGLQSTLLPVTVQGFDRAAIEAYIDRWFPLVARGYDARTGTEAAVLAEATKSACQLKAALKSTRVSWRLMQMSRNPLLLSVLCLVHYRHGQLPKTRAKLYEWCLGVLFEAWDRHQQRAASVPAEPAMTALAPIAWRMQCERRDEGDEAEATALPKDALLADLAASLADDPEGVGLDAPAFLAFLHQNGVLHSPDVGNWRFVHLTFQEYLAARHAVQLGLEAELAARLDEPGWRETILLAAAQDGFFARLLREALEGGLTASRRRVLEAALDEAGARYSVVPMVKLLEAAAAARRAVPVVLTWWQRWLAAFGVWTPAVEATSGPDAETVEQTLLLAERSGRPELVEAARALGRVIGPVAEVPTVGAAPEPGARRRVEVAGVVLELVWVPPGRAIIGSTEAEQAELEKPPLWLDKWFEWERPQHAVDIQVGFWLGRFPVTNDLYAAFTKATGHPEPEAFRKAGFDGPRQAVTSVNWDEAAAFCRWLTETLGGEFATLPTEAEWEWAARSDDQRLYPWGDDPPTAGRAMYERGRPGDVGEQHAGAGPFGAEEQAGTVWEWCASTFEDYPLSPDDHSCHPRDIRGREGDAGARPRVLRGGNWTIHPIFLRCADRHWLEPLSRNPFIGFRVCLRPQHEH